MFDNELIGEQELLQDTKKLMCFTHQNISEDNLDLILNFFSSEKNIELENHPVTLTAYNKLKWNQYKYFDVINSFYTTFVCALVAFSTSNEPYNQYFAKYNHANWNWPIFDYGFYTELSYATEYGLCDIGKTTFSKKATNKECLLYDIMLDFRKTSIGQLLNELASLCHSIANFMPCPPAYERGKLSYNQLKGTLNETADYLPLFIDKIQFCYENHLPLTYPRKVGEGRIEFDTIVQWHEWLIGNRTKYSLDDYYTINENRIIGTPLFLGQSLSYPIPKTEKEICECLTSMVNRIKNRAKLIVQRQKNENGLI